MDKEKLKELASVCNVPADSVQFSGFLGDPGADGKIRLYASLADLTQYVEFEFDKIIACAPHAPTNRVTVSLPPSAVVRVIQNEGEARFFKGNVTGDNMPSASAPAGQSGISVFKCVGNTQS